MDTGITNPVSRSVNPTQNISPKNDIYFPANEGSIALLASVLLICMPHVWRLIFSHQRNNQKIHKQLLDELTQTYENHSQKLDEYKSDLKAAALKSHKLGEKNAEYLRDLLGEIADLRGQVLELNKSVDFLCKQMIVINQQYPLEVIRARLEIENLKTLLPPS